MGFGDPLRFKRKERRCRHFDDDGTPKLRDECPYRSFECWFTHPDEPGWRDCPPRYMGGKYPPGPSSHRDRRGSFSRHHGWDRDRSWSRERERDRGWGDREALRERERGRERSRSRERGRVFAPYGYARAVEREDSVASSREGNSHDNIVHQITSGSRTEPDTPVISTSGTRFGGWTSLQSPITNITTPDPTSRKTVKHTSININVTDNNTPPPPPSVTPSSFPPLPSAEPSQSPHFASPWTTVTTQDFRPSATSTSSVPNGGFVVPSLPPPSTGASISSFAIPPPPSTTTTTSSIPPSPTTSAPPLTASLLQVTPREEQSRTPVFVKSTIPFKFKFSNSPSRSSSPPAVTTYISSSSPIVSSTLPFDVVATATGSTSSAAGSTAPVLTRTIDQSSDIDIPMTALSISTAIPGLASVQNAQASSSTPQEVGPQTQQPGAPQQLPEHPGTQSLPDPISQPLPPPPPLPPLPSFEVAETPIPELSHEAKLELWNKRIRAIADLLMYKDKIQQLTSDIDDLTRYSTSHFFIGDPEEKERIESNLMELESTRETMKQSVQKALDELAGSDTWPSALVVEDVRKQNEKMKEYVVGLADVMKEVSVTLGELAELARIGKKKQKMRRRARARRKDKGKEKEVEPVTAVDAVELEAGEIPTPITEVASALSGARPEVEDEEDAAESDVETSKRSRELADIRAKFESLEDLLQSVVYSLDEAESTWMAGVKEMFQDLVLEQKRTIRERVDQHKGLIEQHAAKLKSSLDQVSDSIATTNTNVTNAVNETARALEKIVRLQNERDTILAEHERFFNEELPRLRTQISDYEVQREKGQKRLGVLEAALNAYVNRPPSASASTALPTTSTNNHKRHHPLIESDYLLQSIKPQLTHLLREGVKPLVEEVRKRVEEMVNAQREEMYANVWNKIGFTWQVLGKVHKSAEIDLGPILRSADSGAGEGGGVGGGSGSVDTVVDDVVPSGSGKPVTSESVNVGTGPTAIGGSTGTTPGLARSMASSNGSANANGSAVNTAGPSGSGSTAPRS